MEFLTKCQEKKRTTYNMPRKEKDYLQNAKKRKGLLTKCQEKKRTTYKMPRKEKDYCLADLE